MSQIYLLSAHKVLLKRWETLLEALNPKPLDAPTEMPQESLLLLDYDTAEELLDQLLEKNLRIFVLQGSPEHSVGLKVLQQGAKGYGNSYMHKELLHAAVQTLLSKAVWIYPELMHYMITHTQNPQATTQQEHHLKLLSPKELEVAQSVAQGNSNKAVAAALDVTERTVKAHLSSIYQKLHVNDRLALALFMKGHHVS